VKILGIVSETHDAGIALLEDGVPVLIIEEERLTASFRCSAAVFPPLFQLRFG
jgi:predicted NodU family carbamoyl transferase